MSNMLSWMIMLKTEPMCCISTRADCQTLGHDPMPQEILRQPDGFLRMTVRANE